MIEKLFNLTIGIKPLNIKYIFLWYRFSRSWIKMLTFTEGVQEISEGRENLGEVPLSAVVLLCWQALIGWALLWNHTAGDLNPSSDVHRDTNSSKAKQGQQSMDSKGGPQTYITAMLYIEHESQDVMVKREAQSKIKQQNKTNMHVTNWNIIIPNLELDE